MLVIVGHATCNKHQTVFVSFNGLLDALARLLIALVSNGTGIYDINIGLLVVIDNFIASFVKRDASASVSY